MVLPSPTSSQSMARPRNRRSTVLAVRIWCSSSSMSRTMGSAISRSNPACVASRAALDRQVELIELQPGRRRAGGLHDRPVAPVELDGHALLGDDRAVGRMRRTGLDDQPEPPGRAVLEPERAVRPRDTLGQLRHDDRAGGGVDRQVERTPRGVLYLLDREPVRSQHPGQAQSTGPADRRHLEPVARLEPGRSEGRTGRGCHGRGLQGGGRVWRSLTLDFYYTRRCPRYDEEMATGQGADSSERPGQEKP